MTPSCLDGLRRHQNETGRGGGIVSFLWAEADFVAAAFSALSKRFHSFHFPQAVAVKLRQAVADRRP
jgi:hypothetical protein